MKDFISLKTVTSNVAEQTSLKIICDKATEKELGIFETLEANVFPQIKAKLEESVNTVVLRAEIEFRKIDPHFEAFRYSEVPVVYNELFFPCDATRYAYLLTTVEGTVEKKWYQFDYNNHVGPFGSVVDNEGNSLSIDVFKFTCFEQDIDTSVSPNAPLYLWPAEIYEIVPHESRLNDSTQPISIVFFVDWRYFARDLYYRNYPYNVNNSAVADSIVNSDGIFSVYENILNQVPHPTGKNLVELIVEEEEPEEGEEPTPQVLTSPITSDHLTDVDSRLHLRNLNRCCLPLAIDVAMAYNGARLYGGRTIDKTFTLSTTITLLSENLPPTPDLSEYFRYYTGSNTASVPQGHLPNAAKRLLATPSEARLSLYSHAGEDATQLVYGVTADATSLSKDSSNNVRAMKGLQGYCFHSILAAWDNPSESDHIYLGLPRYQVNGAKWLYSAFRVEYRNDSFFSGWVLTAPSTIDAYNTVEDNNLSVGMFGNGAVVGAENSERFHPDGRLDANNQPIYYDYKYEEFDIIQPIGVGAIYDDISGNTLIWEDADFSAENYMLCRAGMRNGVIQNVVNVTSGIVNLYVESELNEGMSPPQYCHYIISRAPGYVSDYTIGDTVQYARNPDDYKFKLILGSAEGGGGFLYDNSPTGDGTNIPIPRRLYLKRENDESEEEAQE